MNTELIAYWAAGLCIAGVAIAAANVFTMPKKYDAAMGEWVSNITPTRRFVHVAAAVVLGVGGVLAFTAYALEHFT